jgi:hypothetical protein
LLELCRWKILVRGTDDVRIVPGGKSSVCDRHVGLRQRVQRCRLHGAGRLVLVLGVRAWEVQADERHDGVHGLSGG